MSWLGRRETSGKIDATRPSTQHWTSAQRRISTNSREKTVRTFVCKGQPPRRTTVIEADKSGVLAGSDSQASADTAAVVLVK